MKKRLISFSIVMLILSALLVSCGPPEVSYSYLKFENDKALDISSITLDGTTLKQADGSTLTMKSGERVAFELEFVTGGSHSFVATYSDDTTETVAKYLDVETSSTNTITFGTEPPEYAKINFTNNTGSDIDFVYLYTDYQNVSDIENNTDDTVSHGFMGLFGLPFNGLTTGNSSTLDIPNDDGTFYVYTNDIDESTWVYQGTVTTTLNSTVTFTASN